MSSGSSREEGEEREELSFEEVQADQQGQQQPAEANPVQEEEAAGFLRFYWARTSKGKDLLRRGGFEYVYEANSKEQAGIEYWRCPHRRPYCPHRIHVENQWHEEEGKRYKLGKEVGNPHTHQGISETLRDAQLLMKAHSQSENPVPARTAVGQAREQMPPDIRAQEATSSSSMGRTYRRYVYEARKEVGDDQLDAEVPVLPERFQGITIFDGILDGTRALIFCSEFGRQLLQQYGMNISMDGTFKSCPAAFEQLYTINVIIDSCSIPAVYALLGSKRKATYEQLFERVRNAVPNWIPNNVVSDFEIGAMEAIREIFPQIRIVGCLFHFGQAVFRQVQKLPGLHALFSHAEQNPHNTKIKVKCLISLANVLEPREIQS